MLNAGPESAQEFACPVCRMDVRRLEDGCLGCLGGHRFPVREGIPVLLPEGDHLDASTSGNYADVGNEAPDPVAGGAVVVFWYPGCPMGKALARYCEDLSATLHLARGPEVVVAPAGALDPIPGIELVELGSGSLWPASVCERELVLLYDARLPVEAAAALRAAHTEHCATILVRFGQTHGDLEARANRALAHALTLPVSDLFGGAGLFPHGVLARLDRLRRHPEAVAEAVVRAAAEGFELAGLTWSGPPGRRSRGAAALGPGAVSAYWRMWRLRNSIFSADYDARAHDSWIPPQRYWQRRRHRLITAMVPPGRTLDVGCGSSRILSDLPDATGVDILFRKLRFSKRRRRPVVQASVFALPFPDASFDNVVCSEVIEHVPASGPALPELVRVLRPGGTLVVGTPDYGRWRWRATEWLYGRLVPGGYADEHITHYTASSLRRALERLGCEVDRLDYVGGGEMIYRARRAQAGPAPVSSR
ncbi:MAG: methyltransferase domain-containing protein [Candidatus Dormibacteria bacterium]